MSFLFTPWLSWWAPFSNCVAMAFDAVSTWGVLSFPNICIAGPPLCWITGAESRSCTPTVWPAESFTRPQTLSIICHCFWPGTDGKFKRMLKRFTQKVKDSLFGFAAITVWLSIINFCHFDYFFSPLLNFTRDTIFRTTPPPPPQTYPEHSIPSIHSSHYEIVLFCTAKQTRKDYATL